MDGNEFIKLAKKVLKDSVKNASLKKDGKWNIIPVWTTKVLQNNTGMFIIDGLANWYFEVTYNGSKNQFYVDGYHKHYNECIVVD